MSEEINGGAGGSDFFDTYGLRILQALRRIIRAVDIHSRRLNESFNITAPQMICLYSLARQGMMTQTELTRRVNLSASTVNGIIDRLENKGLVLRNRDRRDRRKVMVEVTPSGMELTRSAPALLQDRFSESLQKLPELEQAAIALSLERVVELMEAKNIDASPNLISESKIDSGT